MSRTSLYTLDLFEAKHHIKFHYDRISSNEYVLSINDYHIYYLIDKPMSLYDLVLHMARQIKDGKNLKMYKGIFNRAAIYTLYNFLDPERVWVKD